MKNFSSNSSTDVTWPKYLFKFLSRAVGFRCDSSFFPYAIHTAKIFFPKALYLLKRCFSLVGPLEAHSDNASTIIGTGMAPEGIEQNDFIYDLMSEMGWRSEKFDLFSWADSYVERRYGSPSNEAKIAWRLLLSSVYNCTDNHADHNHGIPVVRPTSLNLRYSVWYDLTKVIEAWKYLLSCSKELSQSETYR